MSTTHQSFELLTFRADAEGGFCLWLRGRGNDLGHPRLASALAQLQASGGGVRHDIAAHCLELRTGRQGIAVGRRQVWKHEGILCFC